MEVMSSHLSHTLLAIRMILKPDYTEGEEVIQWHEDKDAGIIVDLLRSLPTTYSNFLHLKFTWSFKFNMNIIKMVGSYLKYYLGDKMKTEYSL